MLRVGDREIWREQAFFEDYKRFPEVVELLMARHGTRLKDVVPTGAASFFLWGDRLAAAEVRGREGAGASGVRGEEGAR